MGKIGNWFKNAGRKVGNFAKGALKVGRKIADGVTGVANKVLPALELGASFIPVIGPEIAAGIGAAQLGINALDKGLDVADNVVNNHMNIGDAIQEGIGLAGDVHRAGSAIKDSAGKIKQGAPAAAAESKKIIQKNVSDAFNRRAR